MCATRSSRCTLASTIVHRTSGNTWGCATSICGWRPSPASGASGPLAKAKRKCHPIVELPDAVQSEDVQKFLPEVCRMGIDRLDRSWCFSAWGHRTTRAWNQYGVKDSAERLIKLASHGKHGHLTVIPALVATLFARVCFDGFHPLFLKKKKKVLLLCGVGVVCWCCGVL